MRGRVAAIAAVLLGCAVISPVQAGPMSYNIDFSAVAGDAGKTISTSFREGYFTINLNGVNVIGPGSPDYAGAVGVTLANSSSSIVVTETGADPYVGYDLYSLSATFAPTASGDTITWGAVAALEYQRGINLTFDGTAPTTIVGSADPAPQPAYTIVFGSGNTNEAQLTGLVISADLHLPPAPEPASWVLGIVGMGTVVGLARRGRGAGRATRRCAASRPRCRRPRV